MVGVHAFDCLEHLKKRTGGGHTAVNIVYIMHFRPKPEFKYNIRSTNRAWEYQYTARRRRTAASMHLAIFQWQPLVPVHEQTVARQDYLLKYNQRSSLTVTRLLLHDHAKHD